MDKENHPLTRKELFNKYKLDNKIFFETGTHKGESVQTALDLGFEKVVTVELIHNFFNECAFKFIDKPNVNLFYGHSNDKMDEMLNLVDSPALFWLDGHVDGVNADCLWDELEHIKNHTIKTHTIIVDDIPLYFGDGEKVKEKILEINPDYKFVIEDALNEGNGKNMENWDLIAYI
jgi:hypothetical protein|tara:strand:- start:5095 stop:5622 length:528 start_codon:yes stop_codon:yes gene_type:complete